MLADRIRVLGLIGITGFAGIAIAVGSPVPAGEVIARVESLTVVETPTLSVPSDAEAIHVSIRQRRHTGMVIDWRVRERRPMLATEAMMLGRRHKRDEGFVCVLYAPGYRVQDEVDIELALEELHARAVERELDAR